MKKLLIALPLMFMVLMSCDQEQVVQEERIVPKDWSFIADGIMKPIVLSRDSVDLNSFMRDVVKEIHHTDFSEVFPGQVYDEALGFFVGGSVIINAKQIIIRPLEGENPSEGSSDQVFCGGNEEDDWKSYGTATAEAEVQNLVNAVFEDFSSDLSSGNSIELRLNRNLAHTRVCAQKLKL